MRQMDQNSVLIVSRQRHAECGSTVNMWTSHNGARIEGVAYYPSCSYSLLDLISTFLPSGFFNIFHLWMTCRRQSKTIFLVWTFSPVFWEKSPQCGGVAATGLWVSVSRWTLPLNWLITSHTVTIRGVSLEMHTLRGMHSSGKGTDTQRKINMIWYSMQQLHLQYSVLLICGSTFLTFSTCYTHSHTHTRTTHSCWGVLLS